jgi:transcriptional regulator with XRE-family HTH domain
MDHTTKCNTEHWVYSGEELKSFLQRSDLSYKDAAEDLGIDKNTVGKAVRGGNLNIDIILRICNTYGLNIHDFFKLVEDENHSQTDYYISLDNKNSSPLVISEPEINYKKSKKSESEIEKITESLEEMKNLITILSDQISKGYAIIDEMKKVEKQNY